MRIVFMGSPEFAVPSLRSVAQSFEVIAAVTQPDRSKGRGRKTAPPDVKLAAQELGIEVLQPEQIRTSKAIEQLNQLNADLFIIAAYGQILPQALLDAAPLGALNVHASLLPRWRGASPVQAAIYHQDRETGVTIMKMDAGLDTGPILAQRKTPIDPDETGGELTSRLSYLGSGLLLECLPPYAAGQLQPTPQEDDLATHAPMLTKAEGRLDLSRTAEELVAQIQAYEPWPGSYLEWENERLRVLRAHASSNFHAVVGKVETRKGKPAVGTSSGLLILDQVQPPSRKSMPAEAFVLGHAEFLSAILK
jgi:methionyl-tRNA formyltransferase